MRKKKEGSSLIFVVIIFMFITIVSMAMLSMVSGNYTARISESKRIENLYASESGLNTAYFIIGKTFDSAVNYGCYKVEILKEINYSTSEEYKKLSKEIEELNKQDPKDKMLLIKKKEQLEELKRLLENKEFKSGFKEFINSDNEIDKHKKILINSIDNGSYISTVNYKDKSVALKESTVEFPENSRPKLWIPQKDIKNPIGKSEEINGIQIDKDEKKYTITVKSNFKTEHSSTVLVGENTRTLQATYTMIVPNYDDILAQEFDGKLDKYYVFENRSLTIGGNMTVDDANSLEVNEGDIFVQGKPEHTISNKVYDKYNGGILLKDLTTLNLKCNVVTRGTFNIQSNVGNKIDDINIGKNLFAGNIYAGNPKNDKEITQNAYLKVQGDVVTDNDMALKANDTHFEMNNFYGINDKTIKNNDKTKSSSSIIVNQYTEEGQEPSSIKINGNAYLMGTAYINTTTMGNETDDGYQTGESIAVKGNYNAYSVPNNTEENFEYYSPLQLLKDDNTLNKSNHFVKYWNKNDKINCLNTGGVEINGEVFSNFAVVNGKNKSAYIGKDTINMDQKGGIIYKKQLDYASEVYKFGQAANYEEDYKTYGENAVLVSNLFNVNNINENYNLNNELNKNEKLILNSSEDKTIVLSTNYEGYKDSKYIKIPIKKEDSIGKVNTLIATNGDVIIDGNIELNGTIICNGNLYVKNGNIKINYDKDLIERIQFENINIFRDIFGDTLISTDEDGDEKELSKETDITYDLKNFLEVKRWKIVN